MPARRIAIAARKAGPGARTGKVIGVRGKCVFVDLGGKSEGLSRSPISKEANCRSRASTIEVIVDRFDPEEGIQLLRLKGSAIEADWDNLKKGVIVEARVTKTVKGGLEVDVDGIRGFLPISQIDLSRVDDAASYVNQKFKAIVTEANQREKNLVISRRELLEQERAEQREKTWATLEEGQVRDGVVRSIKDFGAFVDLGGVDGLLPIGEMSWSRVSKVDEMVKIGDQVKVKVLKIDQDGAQAHARPQAAHPQSLGSRRREVSPRDDGQGKGLEAHGLRRVRRARAGDRGLDPHLRAIADPGAQGRRYRQARPGGRGAGPQGRARGQEDRAVPVARQGDAGRRGGRRGRRGRDSAASATRAQDPLEGGARRPRATKQPLTSIAGNWMIQTKSAESSSPIGMSTMPELSSLNPTGRFTGLAGTYARFRPSYPAHGIDFVMARCGL